MFGVLYAGIGAVAGLLAGLLGVGGGLIIVPLLVWAFTAQGLPASEIQRLALGTSLASIVFTSVASFRAHHRRGAVRWPVVQRMAAGILIGTFAGAWVATRLSGRVLTLFFAIFLIVVAVQMLLDLRPKAARQLPGWSGLLGAGAGIGLVSSLVGIGGGTLSVPFLTWCNLPLRTSIGTSAAIGFPIALAGAAGYIVNGRLAENLPAGCFGYVYLPALAGVAAVSVLTAPLGARLAHRLPTGALKRGFAIFLLLVAARLLF